MVSGRDVDAQAHLQRLSIVQAGSIALDVRATAQGPDFRPVLMSRRKAASLEDDAPAEEEGEPPPSGDLADVSTDALLRPDQALVFQREFDKSEATRDAYVLGSGAYVVLAPELKPVIDLVARMRRAPEVERRAFVKNPRSAIAAALGSNDEYATAPLFIETQQYSERVTELQLWERPALPWMQRQAQAWIPEDPIAEQPIISGQPLDAAIRAQVVDAIAVAKARGEDTITIGERTIPLAEAERQIAITPDGSLSRPNEVVDAPIETAKQAAPQGDKSDAQTADNSGGRHILGVLENFEDETFGASLKPRRALIPYDEASSERMGPTRPKAHQRDGFDWLVSSWLAGAPGVLLADDMGLGKTFQCLRFLVWLRANQEEAERRAVAGVTRGPILVVAPTALLHNWEKEAAMHIDPRALGGLARAFGGDLTRLKLPDSERPHPLEQLDTAHLVEAGWILTTYETLSNHQLSFARIQFSAVVFDEAQKIKDPGTINAQAAKTVNADFVLAMTGTPIENRVEDLWSIMDRVHPLRLGNLKAFSGKYGAGAPDALRELNGILKSAGSKRPPLMLRRMKEAILEGLPEKRTVTHPVEMPPVQWKAYDTVIAAAHADVSTEGAAYRGRMLEIIQRLRAVSLHPDPDEKNDRNFMAASARLAKTMEVLSGIAGMGEKVLVFVDSLSMQRRIAELVADRFGLPRVPPIINGATPGGRRQAIVDEFQKQSAGFGLLVLSPKAAGIGLTITAANHVIHLNRWWNPAVEDQCNDRVYRIGQERPVTIHVPMALHPGQPGRSFDEILDQLLVRKRVLSRDLLAPPIGENDIEAIYSGSVDAVAQVSGR